MSIQPDTFQGDLPNNEDIAQRLRSHMGDRKISRSKLALATGINRTSLGKKLDGEVEFGILEIAAVCRALGRSWEWVTLGREEESPRPDGPDGGVTSDQSLPRGSNSDRSLTRSDADVLLFPGFQVPEPVAA